MSWFHRTNREPPSVNVTVVNDGATTKAPPVGAPPGRETDAAQHEKLVAEATEAIKATTSLRARIRAWFTELGWLTFLLGAVSLAFMPSYWWLTIVSMLIANVAMYIYTRYVYKPPVVPVVLYDDDGTGGILEAWAIPLEIWGKVAKTGLSNTISTSRGVTYMVRAISFADNEQRVPVAVEFSWLHYNELNFATKRQMFDELREALRIAWEQNNRYKWLMDVITLRRALAMTKRWISLISHGRYAPVSAQDEAQLNREIEQLARENARLRMPSLEERDQPGTPAEDEGMAPL